MIFDTQDIEIFSLILIRVTSALIAMPIFGQRGIPRTVKIGLGLFLTFLLIPVIPQIGPAPQGSIAELFVLALKETVCGLLIGYAAHFVFYAVEFAGAIVGYQAGFAIVSSIDPMTNARNPVLGRVQYIMVVLIFLSINGHHFFLSGLAKSFETIPLGLLNLDRPLLAWTVSMAAGVSETAIKLAAPVMVALIMTDIGLGILARIAPQMNIFVVGFPLKIGIALLLLSSGMGAFAWLFTNHFYEFRHQFLTLIKLLGST